MKEKGLTKKEWREWEKKVKDNPPAEYEQSEKYKDYASKGIFERKGEKTFLSKVEERKRLYQSQRGKRK